MVSLSASAGFGAGAETAPSPGRQSVYRLCAVLCGAGGYGTSQKAVQLRAGEFAVTRGDGLAFTQAGIVHDTKFSFNQTIELPYTSSYFKAPPGAGPHASPKLGILHATLMRKASAAWNAVNRKR